MLRQLLPSILGFSLFLIISLVAYLIIMRNVTQSMLKGYSYNPIKRMFLIITAVSSIMFITYVINIASVNGISRTSIDKSIQDEGKVNFDSRLSNDTTTNKR